MFSCFSCCLPPFYQRLHVSSVILSANIGVCNGPKGQPFRPRQPYYNSMSSHLRRQLRLGDIHLLMYRTGVPAGPMLFKTESHSAETIHNQLHCVKYVFPINIKNLKLKSCHFSINCKRIPWCIQQTPFRYKSTPITQIQTFDGRQRIVPPQRCNTFDTVRLKF